MSNELFILLGMFLAAVIVIIAWLCYQVIVLKNDTKASDYLNESRHSALVKDIKYVETFATELERRFSKQKTNGDEFPFDEKPKDEKPFWQDSRAINEVLKTMEGENDFSVIADIPQLQNLTPNDAYHALADRLDELKEQ